MYIIIAGGGKVGYYLAKTLLSYKHEVVVIEPQPELCEKLANQLYIRVCNGDSTTIEKLEEVDASRADIFVATTGRDEDNLIACQLAKNNFHIKRTIARINNPKNMDVFKKLGVDMAVSSTSMIAELIEQEIDYMGIKTLIKLKDGKITLNEIELHENSVACGKKLMDLKLPNNSLLISIIRDDDVFIPNGQTVLKKGDYIIAASSSEDQERLKKFFL